MNISYVFVNFTPTSLRMVTGADVIYETHAPDEQHASIVAVQYKIWEERSLRLSDPRLQEQLKKLRSFVCVEGLCWSETEGKAFRFP